MSIKKVHARQIFDSRGNPTVEVDVTTDRGLFRAAVPSGASTGIHEALELRDKEKAYMGKGVLKAVENVNTLIAPAVLGKDPTKQFELDQILLDLDGTENKSKLGANAILGVSLAVCKAGAAHNGIPLYQHVFAQEPLLPSQTHCQPCWLWRQVLRSSLSCLQRHQRWFSRWKQACHARVHGASSFAEAMRMGTEVYHNLKSVISKKYGQDACNVGDEGGFAPNIQDNKEGLVLLTQAIEKAGYTGKVVIGMDVAASEFHVEGKYDLNFKYAKTEGSQFVNPDELGDIYKAFISEFPVVSIEDGYDQDDWAAWSKLTADIGEKVQIVGDDLLVTNPKRIKDAIEKKACNALLLKVNQIGSIKESIEACKMAQDAGWGVMVSHRSGETEDSFIADLVVGLRTGEIKTGAPCRSERLAKYNQLLRIEEELGDRARYAGLEFRGPK